MGGAGAAAGGGAGAAAGGGVAGAGSPPPPLPNSLPPAEIALPGRSITQFTVLPVAFAAVPANTEIEENTLPAKLRGSGSAPAGAVFTVAGGVVVGSAAGGGGTGPGATGGAAPGATAPKAAGGT